MFVLHLTIVLLTLDDLISLIHTSISQKTSCNKGIIPKMFLNEGIISSQKF